MAEFDTYAKEYNQTLALSLAKSGEGFEYFAEYKARYLADYVCKTDNPKILDFGCGVGNVSLVLKSVIPKADIHGYDPSPDSITYVDKKLKDAGKYTSDIQACDHDFDVIFMAGVMHHIQPDQRATVMTQVNALLKPGGRLVIFEHNPLNPVTRRVVDACPFDKDAVLLKSNETIRLVSNAEFGSVKRQFIVFFPKFLKVLRRFESLLGWCPLGAQYAVVGQRLDH